MFYLNIRRITTKRVTSLRCSSPHHSVKATQTGILA